MPLFKRGVHSREEVTLAQLKIQEETQEHSKVPTLAVAGEPSTNEESRISVTINRQSDSKPTKKSYNFLPLYLAFFAIFSGMHSYSFFPRMLIFVNLIYTMLIDCNVTGRTLLLPTLKFFAESIWKEYHAEDKHAEEDLLEGWQHGLLNALFYVSYCGGALLYGPLGDRIGRRPVLLLCLAGMTLGFLLQALSWNFWWLVGSRCFAGLFAPIAGVVQTYLADVVHPGELPKFTSRVGQIYGAVWGFGPLSATLLTVLAQKILGPKKNKENQTWQWRFPVFVGSAVTSIVFIYAFFRLRESNPQIIAKQKKRERLKQQQQCSSSHSGSLSRSITDNNQQQRTLRGDAGIDDLAVVFEANQPAYEREPSFRLKLWRLTMSSIFLAFIADLCVGAHCGVYPLLTHRLKWDQIQFGVIWTIYGLSYSSCNLFYVWLQKKLGPFYLCSLSLLVSSIGNAIIPLLVKLLESLCLTENDECINRWICKMPMQLLIVSPASIMIGIAYGCGISATQMVCADYSRRYDFRKVSRYLSLWMFAISVGSTMLLIQLCMKDIAEKSAGIGGVSFFVTASSGFLGCLIAAISGWYGSDIPMAANDVSEVLDEDKHIGQDLKMAQLRQWRMDSSTMASSGQLAMLSKDPDIAQSVDEEDDEDDDSDDDDGGMDDGRHGSIAEIKRRHQDSEALFTRDASFNRTHTPIIVGLGFMDDEQTQSSLNIHSSTASSGADLVRAHTVTRESVRVSLSSFNVTLPLGLPVLTPAQFLSLPLSEDGSVFEHTSMVLPTPATLPGPSVDTSVPPTIPEEPKKNGDTQ